MFDWVGDGDKLFEADCPACGVRITDGFQSKELDCLSNRIDWKYFSRFYNSCKACNAWVDCYVEYDLDTYKIYAVPDDDQSRRKLVHEGPWDLQGRNLEDWADVIREKGADGVRGLLEAHLVLLGRGQLGE